MVARKSKKVPNAFRETYAAISGITDTFCREYLNEEYGELARLAVAGLCRKRPSPLTRGKSKIWACGTLYALGQINFLSDKSFEPSLSLGELCDLMGVGKSTASAKAKVISEALGFRRFHPDWTLSSLLEHDPFARFIEVNGLIADARSLPVEIQEAAIREGLIPHEPESENRRILVDRYLQSREISTHHQMLMAKRAIRSTAIDIAFRIGLVRDAEKVSSMALRDLAPALDISLFSKAADGKSLADRYLKEVGGRMREDHLKVVEALANARFSIFEMTERHPVAGTILSDLSMGENVWLMDQGFEASVLPGHIVALRLIRPVDFHMTTGVVVSMNEERTWKSADRRHRITKSDGHLEISDRDQLAEAIYAAAVETGALVGAN
jgi:Domain of unknown function (DUF6398)